MTSLKPGILRIGVIVSAERYLDSGLFQKVTVYAPVTRSLACPRRQCATPRCRKTVKAFQIFQPCPCVRVCLRVIVPRLLALIFLSSTQLVSHVQ